MTRVIKLGGTLLEDASRLSRLCRAIVRSSRAGRTIVVHGGGRKVSEVARRCGQEPRFADGLRVTDDAMLEIVLMVLAGSVGTRLVAALNASGARAVGLTGGDDAMVLAEPLSRGGSADLGHVGRIREVRADLLERLLGAGYLPVVAPLAVSAAGTWLNINADQMAAAIAGALRADHLIFLTDVEGVLGEDGAVMRKLEMSDARRLIEAGTIRGGMRPKLEACTEALTSGVPEVLILPGARAHLLAAGPLPGECGTRLLP